MGPKWERKKKKGKLRGWEIAVGSYLGNLPSLSFILQSMSECPLPIVNKGMSVCICD